MKRNLFLALLFVSITSFSQNLLTNSWQFKIGDNTAWKDAAFNSNDWAKVKSGQIWEEQGFDNYDGFAWYRKSVTIPESLKKLAIKQGGLTLNLGTIDDADQTYFNGELLAETGKLPPYYEGAYDKIRRWDIPANKILWGKENIIAIRVFDAGGGGGLTDKNTVLHVKGLESQFSVSAIFPQSNRIFTNSENINFNIVFTNSIDEKVSGEVSGYLISDFKDTLLTSKESISIGKKAKKSMLINQKLLKPGFYSYHVEFSSKTQNAAAKFNFGISPEKIVSPTDRALDFDNFWMRAKRELAAVEPQFKLIRKDSLCTDKRDVYLVEMRSLGNLLVRGWYAKPKSSGKFPAILHVQGYSSNQQMSWGYKEDDMAVFVLNIRGHGNSRDEINPGFPGYLIHNLKDRERYIYRGAYMDCVRAVDFLFSREEVDTRYVVVEGGSQGGALSIVTAALDNERIKLCIPAVPFLSDFPDYFKVGSWPANEFTSFVKNNPQFGWEKVFENLSYFDIKNLAPWVKCPVFMSVGLEDTTCPPHINFAAYNNISSPKSYMVFPTSGHSLPAEYSVLKYEWMKKELFKLKNNTK